MPRERIETPAHLSHTRGCVSPSRYDRWRAAALGSVHVLVAIHTLHWRLARKTLAPLEFNEVVYTLELGVLTASFNFMALAVVATAVFGTIATR